MSNLEPNKQPLILVADTSSPRASLALGEGAELLGLVGLAGDEKRSARMLADIDWLLARLDRQIADLDIFGVITGPGSFTGLRVGLASMKGFAYATGKPMIGMTSLEARARSCGPSPCTCVLINAYRGEVLAQFFSVSDKGEITTLSEAVVAKVEFILDVAVKFQQERGIASLLFSGDGALLHADKIAERASGAGRQFHKAKFLTAMQSGWIVQSPQNFLAAEAALYAYEKFIRGEAVAPQTIAAYYIRPAEAEIKLKLGLIGKREP